MGVLPLRQGCSVSAFKYNYEKLLGEGRSKDQAYAIAADVADENKSRCGEERQRQIENGNYFGD